MHEIAMREEVARKNNFRRDQKQNLAPQATRFDMRVGDVVSHNGNKVTIRELLGAPGCP